MSRKVYLDMTELKRCTSMWMKDTEVIPAGITIYSMPMKHKNEEYERFTKEYDIHFIFEDEVPVIDFYTIPRVDIFATDSKDGYIGTVGQMTDLESHAPICYIDKERKCYLITENGTEFLKLAPSWRENLTSYEEIELYASKEDAIQKKEFLIIEEIEGEAE